MKRDNWVAGVSMFVIVGAAAELSYHIHGSELVVGVATICIWLVAMWVIFQIAKWIDGIHSRERDAEIARVRRELDEYESRRWEKRPPPP